MLEVAAVREVATPHETLLVADAVTGQDAVNVAKAFGERAGITGIVLTRVDGDARGGGGLLMSAIPRKPILLFRVRGRSRSHKPVLPRRHSRSTPRVGPVFRLVAEHGRTTA